MSCQRTDPWAIEANNTMVEAINEQRKTAFQKIEHTIETFKARLLDEPVQRSDEPLLERALGYMALGCATFYSQDLELGQFAALDYAGTSIRSLAGRIDSLHSLRDVIAEAPDRRRGRMSKDMNLKKQLQKTLIDLNMDEWGLDYNEFTLQVVEEPQITILECDHRGPDAGL